MMYNDETLEPLLFRIESWLDRWPWASRYYTNVLLPALGVSSAAGLLLILALHAAAVIVMTVGCLAVVASIT
ncbi:MAG: hypothetical protein II822_06580 [Prevotella sp.]|nr:hypothetical protein [Prevotella sp.]